MRQSAHAVGESPSLSCRQCQRERIDARPARCARRLGVPLLTTFRCVRRDRITLIPSAALLRSFPKSPPPALCKSLAGSPASRKPPSIRKIERALPRGVLRALLRCYDALQAVVVLLAIAQSVQCFLQCER